MDIDSIQNVRDSSRELLKLNRRIRRDEVNDVQRSINQLSISSESFENIVQKLKSKTPITEADLLTLKNGLMEDVKNIEIVLSSHGTLRGLVRELSGNNVRKQCAAAGCCCNLALGDSRACVAVAKSAGPYLIAALDNLTTELAVNCAWALGNLAGSGTKACDVLAAQGALSKLCEMLEKNNDSAQEAATYALMHFAYNMEDDFRSEYLHKLLKALTKSHGNASSCHLAFVLSCHGDFVDSMPEEFLHRTLSNMEMSLTNHQRDCERSCTCELVYVVRTLANMDKEIYCEILNHLSNKNIGSKLWEIFNKDITGLKESLLWFFGNLYTHCGDDVFFGTM